MTSSDDILDQIDNALYDYTVSADAMRSMPGSRPPGIQGASAQMWIADEAGEWQEIPGIGSVEICTDTPPLSDEFVEAWARLADQIREAEVARMRAATETLRTVAEAFRRMGERLRDSEWVDTNGDPVQPSARPRPPRPRRDRTAWQSPHGPAPRRRR